MFKVNNKDTNMQVLSLNHKLLRKLVLLLIAKP